MQPEVLARRLIIWGKTRNDVEAAKMEGISVVGWMKWRKRYNLPSRADKMWQDGMRLAVWRFADNDAEAVRILNKLGLGPFSKESFGTWRHRHWLPRCQGDRRVALPFTTRSRFLKAASRDAGRKREAP